MALRHTPLKQGVYVSRRLHGYFAKRGDHATRQEGDAQVPPPESYVTGVQ